MNLYAVKVLGQVVETRPAAAQMGADGDREALRLLICDRENAVAAAGLEKYFTVLVEEMTLGLVAAEVGLGALTAAQLLLSYRHHGRVRSEAASGMLSGTAPVPISFGRSSLVPMN